MAKTPQRRDIMEVRDMNTIAALNDLCRTAMGITGRLVQTPGICALPPGDQSAIREKVELFDAFTPDNDPHQERDFGSFDHAGHACNTPPIRPAMAQRSFLSSA